MTIPHTHIRLCSGLLLLCAFQLTTFTNVVFGESSLDQPIQSETSSFRLELVAEDLDIPWSLSFLPDGSALLGERESGRLHRLNVATGELIEIQGLPDMLRDRSLSSGLFDVKPHPDFSSNKLLYLVHVTGSADASGLALSRFVLNGNTLSQGEQLFEARPGIAGKWHFGGRLVFSEGYLYLSTGDGFEFSHLAQDLSSYNGKILRLHADGRIPDDNPFVGVHRALPEIWSFGVRNPQGMVNHPETNAIWFNEHGPQGGDEVNIARRGVNYGWPVITYGEEYGGGPIGDGITHHTNMEQPLYYWLPSIAPSGMTFYTGSAFPNWQNSIFVGSLAFTHLNRLVVEGERIIHEERLLSDYSWRIRFVEQGPDGYLYIGNDNGQILRLVPDN